MDWNQPYSCESWATTFGLTYPILDDGSGNQNYGFAYSDYRPKFDDKTFELKQVKNTIKSFNKTRLKNRRSHRKK